MNAGPSGDVSKVRAGILPIHDNLSELQQNDPVELYVPRFPHQNGRRSELRSLPVKLFVACEMAEREERWEVGSFATVTEAIVRAKGMIDSFLLRYQKPQQSGRQLYEIFSKYGPDIYVDVSVGEPVFCGWQYAKKRARQFCGGW